MKHYLESIDRVLEAVSSGPQGLSMAEAAGRLKRYGKNKLKEAEKETLLQRFLAELKDPMLIILMLAALVSGVTSLIEGESLMEAVIILVVVLLNAVLGVYQESKAEKAIEALQKMSAATSAVLRDGHVIHVPTEELVVGDVILLEAGTAVPADCRMLESASVQVEEAALTGESVPVQKSADALSLAEGQKDIPLGDRKNMIYMGSTITYGRGTAVVVATAMDTQMGMIADAITRTVEQDTPLQRKLAQLSKVLSYMVLGICLFIFIFSLLRRGSFAMEDIMETFLIAVSLAVAAIPEGLATVVTIVLSIGVTNMSKRNAVIRRLTAVETLGSTQIICSIRRAPYPEQDDRGGQRRSRSALLAAAMARCSGLRVGNRSGGGRAYGKRAGEPRGLPGAAETLSGGEEPRIGPFDSCAS